MREERPRRKELVNRQEAALLLFLTKALVRAGVPGHSIGLLSPYRAQVELLEGLVGCEEEASGVEVLTIDRAQGRDKDVIL
eukprot:12620170-Ditylum_brightwellii.AAC.1